jgi:hypothetical protein
MRSAIKAMEMPTAKNAIEPIQLARSIWARVNAGSTKRWVPSAQPAATLASVIGVVVRQATKTIATKYVT